MMIIIKLFFLLKVVYYKVKFNELLSGGCSNKILFFDRGRFSFVGGCKRLVLVV